MRFREKTPSKVDKQIDVWNFAIGKPELLVLMDVLVDAKKRTPKSLGTQAFTSRVDSMMKEIARVFKMEGITHTTRKAVNKIK